MAGRMRSWRHVNNRRKRTIARKNQKHQWLSGRRLISNIDDLPTLRALASESLSIPMAVSEDVETQLEVDGHKSPHKQDGKMGDDYGYQSQQMDGFLTAVAKRLMKRGYDFSYRKPFIQKALDATLLEIKVLIAGKTK